MRRSGAKNDQPPKAKRLEVRLTPDQKKLIRYAATLRGISSAEFVVTSALAAATEAMNKQPILKLRGNARRAFVDAVLNSPAPNEAARRAAKVYKRGRAEVAN